MPKHIYMATNLFMKSSWRIYLSSEDILTPALSCTEKKVVSSLVVRDKHQLVLNWP